MHLRNVLNQTGYTTDTQGESQVSYKDAHNDNGQRNGIQINPCELRCQNLLVDRIKPRSEKATGRYKFQESWYEHIGRSVEGPTVVIYTSFPILTSLL
jgi:hypothetical protein